MNEIHILRAVLIGLLLFAAFVSAIVVASLLDWEFVKCMFRSVFRRRSS